MANALDAFRAQREAVDQMHARLGEVSDLLVRLRVQVDGLALHKDLKDTLRDEQMWLVQAQHTMQEVRRWREIESQRVWSPVLWRWWLAVTFSLISTWLAGAGYAWMTEPHAAELERLRREAVLGLRRAAVGEHDAGRPAGIRTPDGIGPGGRPLTDSHGRGGGVRRERVEMTTEP